jgi:RNA polymerase sigma factor (sigma-70 family)
MSVQIEGIGNQKIEYRNHNEIDFYCLSEYLTLAKKAISKFANRFYRGLSIKMLKDEDAISNIANAIMMADWRFDENYVGKNKEKKTRYSYRNQCALWAIQGYVTKNYRNKNKKQKTYSLDHTIYDNEEFSSYCFVVNNKSKSPEEIILYEEESQQIKNKIHEIMCLDFVTDNQKEYIRLYYIEGNTFEKIGKKFRLTREAIRQSIKKAITKIQEYYNV